ncbi:hypothetical protein TrCOL_g1119 [Triparma columacea]|uniref:Uncharacterized protein n=1 Tax=Triparma columacea TaxID=722753 RepID=A0A9W7GE41_9STRA|nr:hypothetical protein TrCOL_g1119 [Triparma columacea]
MKNLNLTLPPPGYSFHITNRKVWEAIKKSGYLKACNASDRPGPDEEGHSEFGPAIHSAVFIQSCVWHIISPSTCLRHLNNEFCNEADLHEVTVLLLPVDIAKSVEYFIGCGSSTLVPSYYAVRTYKNIDVKDIKAYDLTLSNTSPDDTLKAIQGANEWAVSKGGTVLTENERKWGGWWSDHCYPANSKDQDEDKKMKKDLEGVDEEDEDKERQEKEGGGGKKRKVETKESDDGENNALAANKGTPVGRGRKWGRGKSILKRSTELRSMAGSGGGKGGVDWGGG